VKHFDVFKQHTQAKRLPNERDAEPQDETVAPSKVRLLYRPWSRLVLRSVQGHSMLPVLPPGTVVYAWRWPKRLRIGDVIIFVHDGKEKIKRIANVNGDEFYVLGDHDRASTDSRQFGWVERSNVVGRVIWPKSRQVTGG
jgi:nickel-type superoxide dismutase maturation protease